MSPVDKEVIPKLRGETVRNGLLHATRTLASVNKELDTNYNDAARLNPFSLFDHQDFDPVEVNLESAQTAIDPDRQPPPLPNSSSTSTPNTPFTESYCFQIELNDILQRHRAHLSMHDEIVGLMRSYITNGRIPGNQLDLKTRSSFLTDVKSKVDGDGLAPRHETVRLHDGSLATVSIFDLEKMIVSLLTDESLLSEENIAPGLNIITGDVDPNHDHNSLYGEVHTGDDWEPAVTHFCGVDGKFMPISLIVFGDKSHTDLHGSLSVTPIIFTLSIFNQKARNRPQFWRPLAYIPNLSHGRGEASKIDPDDSARDLHTCLRIAFSQFISVHDRGGIRFRLAGEERIGRVWIHFFIGDIEGNNAWLVHYQNSRRGVKRPYRDCLCGYEDMSTCNPSCVFVTPSDIGVAKHNKTMATQKLEQYEKKLASLRAQESSRKRRKTDQPTSLSQRKLKLDDKIAKHKLAAKQAFKDISKRDIPIIFNDPLFPLSDQNHGVYGMMPPELLHTSGSGLIMRMFGVIRANLTDRQRNKIDKLHRSINCMIRRQSERDFPRGSERNGLVDGTKCQSHERRGNLLRLLIISYTKEGAKSLHPYLKETKSTMSVFRYFIKMYLAMEEWFHDDNPKQEVRCSRNLISRVLQLLKRVFPREAGQQWHLPKFHGMTKMQTFMLKYGSGMNFYGGPGESHHKQFVKFPGQNTQRRVNEFSKQVSERVHENLMLATAQSMARLQEEREYEYIGSTSKRKAGVLFTDDEGDQYILSGKFTLRVHNFDPSLMPPGRNAKTNVIWASNNKAKSKMGQSDPDKLLLNLIFSEAAQADVCGSFSVVCYTEMKTECEGTDVTFRACPHFQGGQWFDWAFINFNEYAGKRNEQVEVTRSYPSVLHAFMKYSWSSTYHAAATTSTTPVPWDRLQRQFLTKFTLGTGKGGCSCTVPVTSVARPLMAIKDIGGEDGSYFCVLPRREWSRFFGDKIDLSHSADSEDLNSESEIDDGVSEDCDSSVDGESCYSSDDEVGSSSARSYSQDDASDGDEGSFTESDTEDDMLDE